MADKFTKQASRLTGSLGYKIVKRIPVAFLTSDTRHLLYGLWALEHAHLFLRKAEIIKGNIEYIVDTYCDEETASSYKKKIEAEQKECPEAEIFSSHLANLSAALNTVAEKGNNRPFWLIKNMPGLKPFHRNNMKRKTGAVISAMLEIVKWHDKLLRNAIGDSTQLNLGDADKTNIRERRDRYCLQADINMDGFRRPVERAAEILKIRRRFTDYETWSS